MIVVAKCDLRIPFEKFNQKEKKNKIAKWHMLLSMPQFGFIEMRKRSDSYSKLSQFFFVVAILLLRIIIYRRAQRRKKKYQIDYVNNIYSNETRLTH